jgi:hypothetical protein
VATSSATFFRQMGATAGTALFLSLLFSTVGDKIQHAFQTAGPGFQRALADPAIANDPANAPIVNAVRSGGGLSSGALNDTAFLNHVIAVLARPFKVGFSDTMDMIFLVAAAIMLVAFIIFLFLPQVPLRTQSGISQRAADEAAVTVTPTVIPPQVVPAAQQTATMNALREETGRHAALEEHGRHEDAGNVPPHLNGVEPGLHRAQE